LVVVVAGFPGIFTKKDILAFFEVKRNVAEYAVQLPMDLSEKKDRGNEKKDRGNVKV
jgi:hypothetical protein